MDVRPCWTWNEARRLHGEKMKSAGWLDFQDADLQSANLGGADLRGADLRGANILDANLRGASLGGADIWGASLKGANLGGANLDASCLPLWCGGLGIKIDRRIAAQLAYHFCSMECDDFDVIAAQNSILHLANEMHRDDVPVLEKRGAAK